jgi:hypothetical protein
VPNNAALAIMEFFRLFFQVAHALHPLRERSKRNGTAQAK